MYSFMMLVLVEGKNLQPVIMAIQMGTADFIQEYDPDWCTSAANERAQPFNEINQGQKNAAAVCHAAEKV